MRTFRIGDRVKFLDQQGGGVVTKIISPSLVNVEVNGFDIPTLTKEIVLDYTDDKAGKMFTSPENKANIFDTDDNAENYIEPLPQESDYKQERLNVSRFSDKTQRGVYLAFVPCGDDWLLSSEYYVYLVNNTDYTLLYSLFLKDGEKECFAGEDYGSVETFSRLLIATVEDKDLNRWSDGVIQLLFHKDESKSVLAPSNYAIKLRTSKFYKEGCFENTGMFAEKALMVTIAATEGADIAAEYEKTQAQRLMEAKKLQDMKSDNTVVSVKPAKPQSFFDKHMVNRHEAEVDLHIEELTDTTAGMTNSDMLNIQMNYFNKCLDKALELNLDKIVFIHGVGQGVLKHNIEKELSAREYLHYFPASMQKYGVGATEVIIGKNRK
ncbi:MAG: DUF2027 domain-containing protein [Bacteroidales bacterium]|nr:DUF2027 domain-containing protein [Bacteroidales bacterium]